MQIKSDSTRNFIMCLLLCALIAAGFHSIPAPAVLTNAQSQRTVLFLDAHTLSQPDGLLVEQTSLRRSVPSFTSAVRNIRIGSSYRSGFLFLFQILTFLSVFSNLIESRIVFHDSRYVYQENFTISFIQDMDGRKRNSYL